MNEKDFFEDYEDRILYYHVPTTSNCFDGLWVLSVMFSRWRKDRKARKQEKNAGKESEEVIQPPESKVDTITI